MSGDAAFVGSIPEHYDRGFGPVLFSGYAEDLAKRVAALQPRRVLETAAGTGIVTLRLRELLPESTQLVATDLNAPMLDIAREKCAGGRPVEFEPCDATALPFADQSFDAVACQFGIMFYPDKPLSFREVYRVLRTGGHYLFNVWDSHAHNPFGRIAHEVLQRFFDHDPPQFYRVPFSLHAIDPLKEMLIDAGFTDLSIHVIRLDRTVEDLAHFAKTTYHGNPVADQMRERGADPDAAVAEVLKEFRAAFGDPPIIPLQAIVFSARKP